MDSLGFLDETRAAYDLVAEDYHRLLRGHLSGNPWDRAMLDAFVAEMPAGGKVIDVGCGPGRITSYLRGHGLDIDGLDLSPRMIQVAERVCPGVRFSVGSMTDLPSGSGSLDGLVAWYSIIHVPPPHLPEVLDEFNRVLRPGAAVLLAFHAGDERARLSEAYGHRIALDAYRLRPEAVSALLERAGFSIAAELVRAPRLQERTDQAYLFARKV